MTQQSAFALKSVRPGGTAALEPASLSVSGPTGQTVSVETSQSLVLKPVAGGAVLRVPADPQGRAGSGVRVDVPATQAPGLYVGAASAVANYN